jgi:hypothetical protein
MYIKILGLLVMLLVMAAKADTDEASPTSGIRHYHVDDDDDDDNSYLIKTDGTWKLIWSMVPGVPPRYVALQYDVVFPDSNIISDDIPGHLPSAAPGVGPSMMVIVFMIVFVLCSVWITVDAAYATAEAAKFLYLF